MKYDFLQKTDIKVSKICLGTMTWGEQNTQAEGFEQMNYAVEQGINFFDTAEMYSVPVKPEKSGSTETIIGNWFKETGKREDIILASKAAGPGYQHIRNSPNFSKEHLTEALEGSLKRLQTDYIDLYQLHWPERYTPRFGGLIYEHKPEVEFHAFAEVLETLENFRKEGKIRHIGISNETAWGTMKWIETANKLGFEPPITIQNAYALVNRTFEMGLSEIAQRESIGLLAYSPLAGGLLSGKYLNSSPENARFTLYPNYFGRYKHENTQLALEAYNELAQENNITLTQLALAFVNSRPFLTANIIGATTMEQLKQNIATIEVELSTETLHKIEEIHWKYQNPAP